MKKIPSRILSALVAIAAIAVLLSASSADAALYRPLRQGDSGPDVRELQRELNARGFSLAKDGPGSPGMETDSFGPATFRALRAFQCAMSIACSGSAEDGYGRVGPRTLRALGQGSGKVLDASTDANASYSFEDNLSDSSGQGNAGTPFGSPAYVTGKAGKAMQFDGVDDYVKANAAASLDIRGAVSVATWVKLDSSSLNRKIIGKGAVGSSNAAIQYFLYDAGGNSIGFRVGNGTNMLNCRTATNDIAPGTWHHVTGTYNGVDTIKVYLNGVQKCSTTSAGFGGLTSAGDFTLGATLGSNGVGYGFFNGALDEVKVFPRALSAADVGLMYDPSGTLLTANPAPAASPAPSPSPSQSPAPAPAPAQAVSGPIITVKKDGTGNFTTIQACADVATAGQTCLVSPGTYAEHVKTKSGGTGDSSRVTFKADGAVTMQGFAIFHPYVTVEGFDITGYAGNYDAHITLASNVRNGTLISKGDNCKILNNTIRDGALTTQGILFQSAGGYVSDNCLVKGNKLSNLRYTFFGVDGNNHRFEDNVLEQLNSRDYVYLFGTNHTFIHNIFWKGNSIAGTGNHPDWIQTFFDNGGTSMGHLFEENYIEGLDGVQLGQLNNGGGPNRPSLGSTIKDMTFRRNVFANISNNFNGAIPGLKFDHNTFYRLAYGQFGLSFGGSPTRGDPSGAIITNNAFVGGGQDAADTRGGYGIGGGSLSQEAIAAFATREPMDFLWPTAKAIHIDMMNRGYIDSNGLFKPAGLAINDISQFVLSDAYAQYKTATYDVFKNARELNARIKALSSADYNFVAGSAAMGYPAKKSRTCPDGIFSAQEFCEPHGVNGGDPKFRSVTDLLGPDGKIFTPDDGLKPLPGSPLCGKAVGGTDIGAYSCDPSRVFATGDSGNIGINAVYNPALSPVTASPQPAPVAAPAGPTDTDGDGVIDSSDRCPFTPASLRSVVNTFGCPKPRISTFDIRPNVDSTDITNVSLLELGKAGVGKIRWNQIVALARNTEQLNIDDNLSFQNGKVILGSSAIPELNKPAQITLYGVTAVNPKIMKDGAECSSCVINSFANGILVFTVGGFSTYEVVEGASAPVVVAEVPLPVQVPATPVVQPSTGGGGYSGGGGGGGGGGSYTIIYGNGSASADASSAPAAGCQPGAAFSTLTGQRCPVASASSSAAPAYAFARSLTVGARGEDVRALQRFLNASGFAVAQSGPGSAGNETLSFGPATRAALARYQAARGIRPAAGFFGPATRASVSGSAPAAPSAAPASAAPASSGATLKLGSSGPAVKVLRQKLRAAGYLAPYGSASDVPASAALETSSFGATTESALRKFQCEKGIACSGSGWGIAGPATRAALGL